MQKINVQNLFKSFGDKKVLEGVAFTVEAGQSFVIIGGSGTGKSVILKCILGILQADSGSIKIDDQEMVGADSQLREQAMRKIGMLFQGGALFDSLKVWENVAFGLLHAQQMPREKARERALENLAAVGLEPPVAELYPASLSGGMQKRVALARAIATKPEIIFFDEPTTGLDPIMSGVINELIIKCVRDLGACAVTITHDMASVRTIADQVGMLHQGRIIWKGSVHDLKTTDNPFVDQFVHGKAHGPITDRTS